MLRRKGPCGPFDTASTASLATLAALGARDATAGDLVWVETLRRPFVRDAGGGAAEPGQVVPCTDGSGAWRSLPGFSSPASAWATQAEWHIDAAAGSVEGLGTAGSPISSWAELLARVGGQQLPAGCTISIHSDLPEVLDLSRLVPDLSGALVTGEPGRTLVHEDEVATFTNEVLVAPGEAPVLTAPGIADWTPYEGRRLRFATASESLSSVARANPAGVGLNVARLPLPCVPMLFPMNFAAVPTYVTPPVGTIFSVETLPSVRSIRPPGILAGQPIVVRGIALPDYVWPAGMSAISGGTLFLVGCTAGEMAFFLDQANFQGCCFGGLSASFYRGQYDIYSTTCRGSTAFYGVASQNVHVVYQGGLYAFVGDHYLHHVGAFDAGGAGVDIAWPGVHVYAHGVLYGSGNGTYGVSVARGFSGLAYTAKPVITGTTNDARIAGVAYAWPAIPTTAADLAGIVTP